MALPRPTAHYVAAQCCKIQDGACRASGILSLASLLSLLVSSVVYQSMLLVLSFFAIALSDSRFSNVKFRSLEDCGRTPCLRRISLPHKFKGNRSRACKRLVAFTHSDRRVEQGHGCAEHRNFLARLAPRHRSFFSSAADAHIVGNIFLASVKPHYIISQYDGYEGNLARVGWSWTSLICSLFGPKSAGVVSIGILFRAIGILSTSITLVPVSLFNLFLVSHQKCTNVICEAITLRQYLLVEGPLHSAAQLRGTTTYGAQVGVAPARGSGTSCPMDIWHRDRDIGGCAKDLEFLFELWLMKIFFAVFEMYLVIYLLGSSHQIVFQAGRCLPWSLVFGP